MDVPVPTGLGSWAAAGIMVVLISATIFHVMRNEMSSAGITAVMFAMANFVAYMRWRVLPIRSRGGEAVRAGVS